MVIRCRSHSIPSSLQLGLVSFLAAAALAVASRAGAQAVVQAVGGVAINADGVLANAREDSRLRVQVLEKVPAALGRLADLRKVSLGALEAAIARCHKTGKALPEEIKFLGGLQAIRYVLVYPEQKDLVLVGPGEGWKADSHGNIVGVTSGRPVMLLDDLLVALRTAAEVAQGGITCSIDPTPEGMRQLRAYAATLHTIGDPGTTASNIEQVLGPQQISFSGVPATSHFARVLVAADYRMKRLAMGFEPAPVRGLPSFLQMSAPGSRGMSSMMPRWWLEPKYEAVLHDSQRLAWELRGGSVQAMTEEDFLDAAGQRQHTGKANPVAQHWANNMTAKYDQLSAAMPIFGQLRNCMELAIVAALIVKEDLPGKAGNSLPALMSADAVKLQEYRTPKQVDSQASLLKKGHKWLISASGGVSIQSWAVVDRAEKSDAPAAVRAKTTPAARGKWCWN
ncbi:MAG: DUF1598 domain-containing protein [Thermoguttaceae bacterium]